MSDRVSALNEATFKGQVELRESGLRGMITVRGDLSSTDMRNAATGVTGLDWPDERGARCVGERGLCWMSPDELLILMPYGEVKGAVTTIAKTLEGSHFMAVDVSDARASFTLDGEGPAIRNVLAKLTPADLRPSALPTGEMRRTRLAQVPAALWFHEQNRAEVICFRSVAEYVWGLLVNAAEPGGEVGYFRG